MAHDGVAHHREARRLEHAAIAVALRLDLRALHGVATARSARRLSASMLERIVRVRRTPGEDPHLSGRGERVAPTPDSTRARSGSCQSPNAHTMRVPRTAGRVAGVRHRALNAREPDVGHPFEADLDHRLALVGGPNAPTLPHRAGGGEHLGARPARRHEHALPGGEHQLGDEVEVVRHEPRDPLLDVARSRRDPRGSPSPEGWPTTVADRQRSRARIDAARPGPQGLCTVPAP